MGFNQPKRNLNCLIYALVETESNRFNQPKRNLNKDEPIHKTELKKF